MYYVDYFVPYLINAMNSWISFIFRCITGFISARVMGFLDVNVLRF